jgi:putative transposase
LTVEEKRLWINVKHADLSIAAQCRLIDLPRCSYYYEPRETSQYTLMLMRRIDEIYTGYPFYGSRKITQDLRREGHNVNRKRVQGVMRELGLVGQLPSPNTSKSQPEHHKFPYLLRGLAIIRPLQVWSSDITYIRLPHGFVYLVAVMDWFSRLALSHRLSNSLESGFCIEAFEDAVENYGRPEIFNTDQGVQFSSREFVDAVLQKGIRFSMDGRGRALDNVFVERLWRTVKYEEVYQRDYQSVQEARSCLENYFRFYNTKRLHQSLGYRTPTEIHQASTL